MNTHICCLLDFIKRGYLFYINTNHSKRWYMYLITYCNTVWQSFFSKYVSGKPISLYSEFQAHKTICRTYKKRLYSELVLKMRFKSMEWDVWEKNTDSLNSRQVFKLSVFSNLTIINWLSYLREPRSPVPNLATPFPQAFVV